jgi:DNA polymerase-4
VTIKLRYADFTTKTARVTLALPTDLEVDLGPAAAGLLRKTWTPGAGLRLIGVGVSGFGVADEQLDLFEDEPEASRARSRALVEGVDAVRERFGDDAIGFGLRGVEHPPADQEG